MYEEGTASAEEWMDFDEQEARAAADAEEAEREAADHEHWEMERELENREVVHDPTTRVFDIHGKEVTVGGRVKLEWRDSENVEHFDVGTVKSISDPDGDVDDEGRGIAINPKVTVEWDGQPVEGSKEEVFNTHNSLTGWGGYMVDPEWEVEEIEVNA